jgi:hypothetical protein
VLVVIDGRSQLLQGITALINRSWLVHDSINYQEYTYLEPSHCPTLILEPHDLLLKLLHHHAPLSRQARIGCQKLIEIYVLRVAEGLNLRGTSGSGGFDTSSATMMEAERNNLGRLDDHLLNVRFTVS